MTDEERLMLHHASRSSLRENLVTLRTWTDQMWELERCPLMTGKPELTDEELDHQYVTPYTAFEYPAWYRIMQRKFPTAPELGIREQWIKLTIEEMEEWRTEYTTRIHGFSTNAVTEAQLQDIDNNYDIGCIQHLQSGYLFMFEYSALKCMELRAMPVALQYYLGSKYIHDETRNIILMNTYYNRDKYHLYYTPTYIFEDGDRFHYPDVLMEISDMQYYSREEVDETIEYIKNMLDMHAKVIRV